MKFIRKALPILAALAVLAVPAALATYTPVLSVAQGGTGGYDTASVATALSASTSGSNSNITSLTGLTTALTKLQGGTEATSAGAARTSLGIAVVGANADITSFSGLTTALAATKGGTGHLSWTAGDLVVSTGSNALGALPTSAGQNGKILGIAAGVPAWIDDPVETIATNLVSSSGTAQAGFNGVDSTSGVITMTLPTAPAAGTLIEVKKTDVSANAVSVARGGSSLIDGATAFSIPEQYQSVTLTYDGTNWLII
jgi:hypothetical protein